MQQSSLRRRPSAYELPPAEDLGPIPDPSTYNQPRARNVKYSEQQQPQFGKKLSKQRGGASGIENRDLRKSRIGDKIKKRMSMRYADSTVMPSLPVSLPPAMPVLPEIREKTGGREVLRDDVVLPSRSDREKDEQASRAADVEMLAQENFDPDAYLKTKLANSTESEIRTLQSSLAATKAATAADLQRNVYKNYEEFVLISKEISTLENDMLELKESLAEWKSMPYLLNMDDSSSNSVANASTADRRRTNRSSVADLRTLYATQLTELHIQIEGSAKFVPAIPGRHIVSEFPDVWALNSATYKVEYAVHIVLLDDSFLVAKKRKKRSGGPGGKLVAERCWNLGDVVLVDVKDSVELTHVIKLRRGKETHVFRTDSVADKKSLLTLFRQVSEELAAKKRKEREGEHERRRSVWTGDRMSMAPGIEPMPSLPTWLSDLKLGGAGGGAPAGDSKREKDIGEYVDKLAVAIAVREWEESVALVEQAPPATLTRLSPLKTSLVADLLQAISDPANRKQSIVKYSAWLSRLGASIPARDAFLKTRTEVLRKRARMIRFEGNVSLYVSELALVTFTIIKHTSEWYLASWREHDLASGMVNWAKDQISQYATMFRKQVYGSDVDDKTIRESVQVTKLQSKRLLQDIGLDFSFLLESLLAPPVASSPIPPPLSSTSTQPHAPAAKQLSVPAPLNLQPRSRSPKPNASPSPSPSPVPPVTPRSAIPPNMMKSPPPRSRERPMSGSVGGGSGFRGGGNGAS